MKIGIIAGNTEVTTLLNTNKVGTEMFGGLSKYQVKTNNNDGGTYYANATKEMQGDLSNLSGSVIQVDRTVIIGKKSEITLTNPMDDTLNAEVYIETLAGKSNMGNKHINSIFIKNADGKLEQTNNEFIVEPSIDISKLVNFTNTIANGGMLSNEGVSKLQEIKSVDSVIAVELFNILKENVTEEAKNQKSFIKESAKLGVDFDDKDFNVHVADFRGIRYSDIELIEAKNKNYYNPEHYSTTENIIIEDMYSFMNEKDIELDVKTTNTNFIDYGHDETGNIFVIKNAKIPEVNNGFMFKNLGLNDLLKPIGIATNNINNLLSPARDEEKNKKILSGIEALEQMVQESGNKLLIDTLGSIDITKVVNSNSIKDVSKEYNRLISVAFSVKSAKIDEFANEHNILKVELTNGGEGRIVGKKFGYERESGLSINGENIILRMAAVHEIRPLTIDSGVAGGMQVKSNKITALEYLFNDENKLLAINNGASLSNYARTYNKLSAIMENLVNGVKVTNSDEKRYINEKEFEQLMFKGKIFGKDENEKPKYTGYGLKSVADIFSKQKTNVTTGEAILEFRKKVEDIYKDGGAKEMSDYLKSSQDKLIKVFREFHDKAFPEFNKNKIIANTQWKNYGVDKDGNDTKTKQALNALIGGTKREDLGALFGKEASDEASSLVSKAKYISAVTTIANAQEQQRLQDNVTIKEENKKYSDVKNIASAIGASEYRNKNRVTTYYNTELSITMLQSPKTNFNGNTDKGLLVKNEDGANVPNLEVLEKVLKDSKEVKKNISETLSAMIKEQISERVKTTHLNQGVISALSINKTDGEVSPREEDEVSNTDNALDAKKRESEVPGELNEHEKTFVTTVKAMLDEAVATNEVVEITEEEEINEAIVEDKNDIQLDLSMFDIDEDDDIEIQKASSVTLSMQKDQENVQAVGKSLLR